MRRTLRITHFLPQICVAIAMLLFVFAHLESGFAAKIAKSGKSISEDDPFPPAHLSGNSVTLERGSYRIPTRPEQLPDQPFRYTVPQVTRTTTSAGLRVFYYPCRDLPIEYFIVVIKAGTRYDPAEKVGLADLTARVVRAGGAGNRTGDEVDAELEKLGAELSVSVERDYIRFQLFTLSENAEKALEIFRDVLMAPRFEEEKFTTEKNLALERLRRQNDDPAEVSRREFRKILYGTTHPLARTPSRESLASITLDDLKNFYRAHYHPVSAWVGVVHNRELRETSRTLEQLFSDWRGEQVPQLTQIGEEAPNSPSTVGRVYFSCKPGAQMQIRTGHFGRRRDPADQPVVDVLNNLFGTGGFSSRLMKVVRTQHGFAYGVGGGVFEDDPIGLFVAVASTKTTNTTAALEAMRSVIVSMLEEKPSVAELETAKRDVLYTFATRMDNPREIVWQWLIHDFYGFPPEYLLHYPDRVGAVTADDVVACARRYIKPKEIRYYLVGACDALRESLAADYSIEEWPLTNLADETTTH